MDLPKSEADWGAMTPRQEAEFEARAEKEFRSHRQIPNGRNFLCWNRNDTPEMRRNYNRNYDLIRWDV